MPDDESFRGEEHRTHLRQAVGPAPHHRPDATARLDSTPPHWTGHRAPAPVPVYRPTYFAPVIVTVARTDGAEVAITWIVTAFTAFYMLPWTIAATRDKSSSVAVALVDLFLGWSFIGWIVALVMACTAHRVAYAHHRS